MEFIVEGISLVAVIIGIGELLKLVDFNKKFLPVVNLAVGIIGGIVYISPSDLKTGILQGLVIGLTASGLYSGVKNTSQGFKE